MWLYWKLIVWLEDKGYVKGNWNKKGYRKARGGLWGLWEVEIFIGDPFFSWCPSACEHYPPPPLATHTEPLETENYT